MFAKEEKGKTEKSIAVLNDDPAAVAANSKKWNLRNMRSTLKFLYRNTTVEPMLGCYIIASVLASLATQNLNLQKACRVNLAFDDEICTALEKRDTKNYTHEEIQVQQLVAQMIIWRTILQSSIPAVLIMFIGSWSDRTRRRKPCMLVPIIGELMTSLGLIVCTYFFYELPMEVAGFMEGFFPAITGGWMTMFMAVFCYVGDITSEKTRTLRIGVVNVFCSVGVPIGTALSGILYKELGSYGVYTISSCLYFIAFLYGLCAIREADDRPAYQRESNTVVATANGLDNNQITDSATAPPPPPSMTALATTKQKKQLDDKLRGGSFLSTFFDLSNIKETFRVTFKQGENKRRIKITMLMIVVIVVMGPLHGEMTVLYLFTRVRFNWDEVDFSIFSTYTMVTNLLGTMFSVGVFSHLLKIDDAMIGVMSCVSKILAGFVYAFAATDLIFYLAPIVDIVNGTSFIAMRSIISKLVTPDELGKVTSLFGVSEAIVPLIYGPMYSVIYSATLNSMPGAFFLVGGVLTAPAVFIFWWMYAVHKKEQKELEMKQDAEAPPPTDEKQLPGATDVVAASGYKSKKNSIDFVFSTNHHDFDLKVILDSQIHRGSAPFIGIDNMAFRSEPTDDVDKKQPMVVAADQEKKK